jgi:hypothetical protein
MDLVKLRAAHAAYNERLKAKGVKLATYKVPCCGQQMEDRAPDTPGAQWDSLASCIHCGALFVKIATFDKIEALAISESEQEQPA